VGLFDRILGKGKSAATATPVKTSKSEPIIKPHGADPTLPAGPGASGGLPGATVPVVAATEKKGLLRKMESNIRRAVDGYVDKKADALLDDATKRAEEFREETLNIVQDQAMQLLDITEQRIDKKLQDIESLLEERLQAELRMRLRALIWTLAFVLIMAIISVLYVWIKRSAGLENAPGNAVTSGIGNRESGIAS